MLASITYGTFYFFLGEFVQISPSPRPCSNRDLSLTELSAFCLLLIGWVYFFVPETRGVRIEDMDKIFGGSDGEADMSRMAEIRQRLGLDVFIEDVAAHEDKDLKTDHIEEKQ